MAELVKSTAYNVLIIWHPTKEEAKEGKVSKLVLPPSIELGVDPKVVSMKAIKSIPAEYDSQLDQIEVAVRPF